jgi:TBC domain-containing protein kinase-like protein
MVPTEIQPFFSAICFNIFSAFIFAERISVVCELFPQNLTQIMAGSKTWEAKDIILLLRQILEALAYLEENGIVHRALDPDNVLFGWSGEAKLFNYGLFYMTGEGKFISFPIG